MALLTAATDDARLVMLALLSGLNTEEIAALCWDQIDFTEHVIRAADSNPRATMTIAAGAARRRKTAMTMAALSVHARVRAMTMMMIEAVAVAMAAGTAIVKGTRRPRAGAVSCPNANDRATGSVSRWLLFQSPLALG